MLYIAIAICFVALLAWDVLRRRTQLDAVDKSVAHKLTERLDAQQCSIEGLEHALKNLHAAQARSATNLHSLTGSRKRRAP